MSDKSEFHQPPGLYIHVPFCTKKCRYCAFYSEPVAGYDSSAVVDAMLTEMDAYEKQPRIKTAYIGGGSPSCLRHELLIKIVKAVLDRWGCPEEFTIEFNPSQTEKGQLQALRSVGVNRISIGAQSFDQSELDFLGREQTVDSIDAAVGAAKAAGFENISLDLIFAIPNSSVESFGRSVDHAIDLGIQHISAYSLSYEKGTELLRALKAKRVMPVDEETDRRMYELAIEKLQRAGFEQYEISNFAKKGFQCIHNHIYWANDDYIGIGPAATTHLNGRRRTNIADIEKYVTSIKANRSVVAEAESLSRIEKACETAVLNLRRRCGIVIEEFKQKTGYDPLELFAEVIKDHQGAGFIEVTEEGIFLTRQALSIADSILCDFSIP